MNFCKVIGTEMEFIITITVIFTKDNLFKESVTEMANLVHFFLSLFLFFVV